MVGIRCCRCGWGSWWICYWCCLWRDTVVWSRPLLVGSAHWSQPVVVGAGVWVPQSGLWFPSHRPRPWLGSGCCCWYCWLCRDNGVQSRPLLVGSVHWSQALVVGAGVWMAQPELWLPAHRPRPLLGGGCCCWCVWRYTGVQGHPLLVGPADVSHPVVSVVVRVSQLALEPLAQCHSYVGR